MLFIIVGLSLSFTIHAAQLDSPQVALMKLQQAKMQFQSNVSELQDTLNERQQQCDLETRQLSLSLAKNVTSVVVADTFGLTVQAPTYNCQRVKELQNSINDENLKITKLDIIMSQIRLQKGI